MRKIDELKLKIKGMAEEIKSTNKELKAAKNNGSVLMYKLYRIRYECRHHHIAYCELRGRTRDQIEQPREHNEANERAIETIKAVYAWEVPNEELQVAG